MIRPKYCPNQCLRTYDDKVILYRQKLGYVPCVGHQWGRATAWRELALSQCVVPQRKQEKHSTVTKLEELHESE